MSARKKSRAFAPSQEQIGGFVEYVHSFYSGDDPVYPECFAPKPPSLSEIKDAVSSLLAHYDGISAFDSVEREMVRDIMLAWRGENDCGFPQGKSFKEHVKDLRQMGLHA